ncbi:unnamed protein product [Peronospora belbahrii]|uniref:Uncharacterized protein n=1 Tax=Peronospora belbahrii TaxID=622444 RepID=A0AAU9L7E2_9STRA|nr:unnamed protein product [Peronospora belbahrii]CAH0513427.1 unnamed protein product [Peronospora belbahrii]
MSPLNRLVMGVMILVLASGLSISENVPRDLMSIDVNAAPVTPRNGFGSPVVSSDIVYDEANRGGTVTVSTYEGNGLWTWLKTAITKIRDAGSRLLPGVGPRSHQGEGTVLITEDKEAGTITIQVINDIERFKLFVKLSQRVMQHAPLRLRGTTNE